MNTITPHEAVRRMRQLTAAAVPFSFKFYSYNSTTGNSDGHKVVPMALLRQGYRNDQSNKAHILIGYTNHTNGGTERFFNMALLLKFNGYIIKP